MPAKKKKRGRPSKADMVNWSVQVDKRVGLYATDHQIVLTVNGDDKAFFTSIKGAVSGLVRQGVCQAKMQGIADMAKAVADLDKKLTEKVVEILDAVKAAA